MLRNKYRPKSLKTFIGNENVISSLEKVINTVQVFLFHGPRGTGKTTLARIIARQNKVDFEFDLYEMNCANKTGVEDARNLEEMAFSLPSFGDKKAFILDEAHRLTGNAQDSLLKVLEEPPSHTIFILCTTNPQKIISTIRGDSRTFDYGLKPLKADEIKRLLKRVIKKEAIEISPKVMKAIIKNCQGIPRTSLVMLEKVIDISPNKAIKLLQKDSEEDTNLFELSMSLINGESWKVIKQYLSDLPDDIERARKSIFGIIGAIADKSYDNKQKDLHYLQGAFEDNLYDNGLSGLKRQIREAYLIRKNVI